MNLLIEKKGEYQCISVKIHDTNRKMNVYDFDETIYDGDSTIDFYKFCIKRNPSLVRYLPIQIIGAIKYFMKLGDKTQFKEKFYTFLHGIDNVEKEVKLFWDCNQMKIKSFYINQREEGDIIISASPEFLLQEICGRLHIDNLIASQVNKKTGKYCGKNCYGQEKVYRFRELYGMQIINNFYSDSKSDSALAQISEEAYLVNGETITKWNEN